MDLSKLPKLSQSPPPPDNDASDPQPANASTQAPRHVDYHPYREPGIAAEVWISAIIGLIFLLMGWNFARYMGSVVTGQPFHTGVNWTEGPKAGSEVAYTELEGLVFWNDSAMFFFGVALLAEAVVILAVAKGSRFQRALAGIGFFLAFISTAYNVLVAGIFFNAGILPIISLLAVAFGGYMAMYLWRLFQSPVAPPPRLTS